MGRLVGLLRSLFGGTGRSLRSNAGLATLSLVLAFSLWIFVTDTEETRRSGVLPVDIPVEAVNVPSALAVEGAIAPVRVRLEVAEDVWDGLTTDDFRATVDLFGLQEGNQPIAVMVEALSSRGGLRITQTIPEEVEVILKPLFSKSVPVVVEIIGDPLDGYELGDPLPESKTVVVSGSEELVALVREARTQVEVTGLSGDLERAFRLRATDGLGRGVEGVVVEPAVINIRVPIGQGRVLLVSPTVQGSVAEGYNVAGVTVEPAVVTVVGSVPELSALRVVPTERVIIEGATSDVLRTVSLQVPTGVSIIGSQEVEVRVRIRPALGQATFQVTPDIQNLDSDLRIANSLPTLTITLTGELLTLTSLSPLDIIAALDLDALEEGSHMVSPKVEAPPDVAVVFVTPSEVEVVLEVKP